jgi:hypothetical protein
VAPALNLFQGHSLERPVFYSPNTRNFTQDQHLILMQAGDLLSVAQVRHTLSKAAYLRQIGEVFLAMRKRVLMNIYTLLKGGAIYFMYLAKVVIKAAVVSSCFTRLRVTLAF